MRVYSTSGAGIAQRNRIVTLWLISSHMCFCSVLSLRTTSPGSLVDGACLNGLGAPVMISPKQGTERHLLNWTCETVHLLPDVPRARGPWALSRCKVVLAARGSCPERTPGLTPRTAASTSSSWNDCFHPPCSPPPPQRTTQQAVGASWVSGRFACAAGRTGCADRLGVREKCYRRLPGFWPHQLSAWWCHLPRYARPAGVQTGGKGPGFYLHRLPVAAVTAYQQPDGSKQQQFILSWFWVPAVHYSHWARVTVWAGLCTPNSAALAGNPLLAFSSFWWFWCPSLVSTWSQSLPFPSACIKSPSASLSLKDTCVWIKRSLW